MNVRLSAALLMTLLVSSPALAHEYWLSPSLYRAAARDTVRLSALVGTGFRGESAPYAAPRAVRFELHANKTLDLRRAAMNGDLEWLRFLTADDGGAVVAFESSFTPIELPADEFDRYLVLEGLDGPLHERARLGTRAGPGRERYARCAKTWIAGRELGRVTKPIGLSLEVVPLDDPGSAKVMRVKVLYRGRPLAGTLVRAWNQPLASGFAPRTANRDSVGPVAQVRTRADGIAAIALSNPGEWLVSTVHMVPSADRAVSDWESLWASFTFARSASKP